MAATRKRREEERRLEEEEADRLALEAAALMPRTFHNILEEHAPVLAFLSLACAAPAFRASKETRSFLSALMTVHIAISVSGVNEVPGTKAFEEARRRSMKVRERLPQSSAAGPLAMYLRLVVKEPIRRAILNRSLERAVPLIRWEDCKRVKIVTHENMEMLDKFFMSHVCSMGGFDAPLLVTERIHLKHLTKISLTMSQFLNITNHLMAMGEELLMPNVTRLKITIQDAGFDHEEFRQVYAAFPGLQRLHLVTLPSGLLPLCGPGIMGPPDLRLSLSDDTSDLDRHANFFVASHLMSLPFSWGGDFLRGVIRLQFSELNEDLKGLSLEKLLESMKGGSMPVLKRLGTVSARAGAFFDVSREDCQLEELVVVTELEDVKEFFGSLLPLEQRKKRGTLRRLAVHIVCSDGAARVKMDVENALCAGWYNIAARLMRADGWIVFSTGAKALQETALGQLPWFLPEHFSLDTVNYGESQLPVSTPLERPLPYYGTEGVSQPSGTLVCGNLRPDAAVFRSTSVSDQLAENSVTSTSSMGPSSPGASSDGRRLGRQTIVGVKQAGQRQRRQEWMNMYLVDACEALAAAEEAQRIEFMNARPGPGY